VHLADDLIDAEPPAAQADGRRLRAPGGRVLGREPVPARRPTSTASSRQRGLKGASSSRIDRHRREAQAGGRAVDAGGGRPLHPHRQDLRAPRSHGKPGAGGEIQLTDGIAPLLMHEEQVLAYQFEGTRYDCGSKLGYMQANLVRHAAPRGRRGVLRVRLRTDARQGGLIVSLSREEALRILDSVGPHLRCRRGFGRRDAHGRRDHGATRIAACRSCWR
jgi:hypothetical protein